MFARLWWKEARQTWPAWAFLALVGVGLMGSARYFGEPRTVDGYVGVAGLIAVIHLFLIAAATFAGERENGTLGLLDAMPVGRLRLWWAKASFAAVSTLALGGLLWGLAAAFAGIGPVLDGPAAMMVVWGLVALGWGLLWSTVLGNAMHAAVLAMTCLGATLVALADLQQGPTLQNAPALLAVGLATAAASAFAFARTGPPRWERRRERPAPADALAIEAVESRRSPRLRTSSAGRLAWRTWRGIRADLPVLLAVALGAVAYFHLTEWDRSRPGAAVLFLGMGIVGLMTGVSAFNAENRGGTHRFLNQHGVRPGLVWVVKTPMWWATMVVFSVLLLVPIVLNLGIDAVRAEAVATTPYAAWTAIPYAAWTAVKIHLSMLTIVYATGALCGMAFRRGIMAGAVAIVLAIVLAGFLGISAAAGILAPTAPFWVALALMAVTWAWSGDWLRFPPGPGKWARLAGWCGLAIAVLVPGYLADRVWNVPTIPPVQAARLFQPERFVRSSPPDENAAPLYREAARLARSAGAPLGLPVDDPRYDEGWLEEVGPALAIAREASRLPNCEFEDVRKATIFTWPETPWSPELTYPLAVSSARRLARGDLDGSWEDVATLLRMARQFSTVRVPTYFEIESAAVGAALRWADDARQTADSLERALAAFRHLPPGYSPEDRTRLDRIVFRNTTLLPWENRIDEYLVQYGFRHKTTTAEALGARVVTSPWEMARARKVYDVLSASWIQMLGDRPYADLMSSGNVWGWARVLSIKEPDGRTRAIGPTEMSALAMSSPIVLRAIPGTDLRQYPRVEVGRRALALVLRLRLYQTRHDGALPGSLEELPRPEGGVPDVFDPASEIVDPYARGSRFGYVNSHGQPLVPLADAGREWTSSPDERAKLLKPSGGHRLLYSVGPDLVDDRAERGLDYQLKGDMVYPLKDGVKPPAAGSK